MTNPVLVVVKVRGSAPGVGVLDPDNDDHWVPAGRKCHVWCPACDSHHSFAIVGEDGSKPVGPCWTWDGDMEKPTFANSMLVYEMPGHHPRCHSYLRDGRWEFLNDCTHDMAGQKDVPMVPLPDRLVRDDEEEK